MTDIWNILGIEATNDKKLIKKAYAKKLKVTKPDEDPVGFKALYSAYQSALDYAKHGATPVVIFEDDWDDSEHDWEETEDDIYDSSEAWVESDSYIANTPEVEEKNTAKQAILEQVKILLSDIKSVPKSQDWQFITDSPFIFDDEFNFALGLEIIHLLYEYKQKVRQQILSNTSFAVFTSKQQREKRKHQVTLNETDKIFIDLDGIFSWSFYETNLSRILPPNQYREVFEAINNAYQDKSTKTVQGKQFEGPTPVHNGINSLPTENAREKKRVSRIKRMVMGYSECAMFFILLTKGLTKVQTFLFDKVLYSLPDQILYPATWLMYGLYIVLCEISPMKKTISMFAFDWQVVNKNASIYTSKQSLFRTAVLIFGLPIAVLAITGLIFLGPAGYIATGLVFAYAAYSNRFLHDYFSETEVIKST